MQTVAQPSRLLGIVTSGIAFLLAGCGSSTNPATPVTASGLSANLGGNWLLAGSMPTGYSLTSSSLSVTATFDVNGSTVSGIVQVQVPCVTIGAIGSPLVLQGTVAADGSFTLNSAVIAGLTQSFTLQGKVPAVAGGPWTGSFSFTNSGTACAGTTSGQVTATSFPSVTGAYSATAGLGNPLNGLVQSVGLKFALQQGASLTTSGIYSNLPLTGTLTVTNSTCITSGTSTGAPLAGFVEGAQIGENFLMNDGSTVLLDGQVATLNGSTISAILITTNSGTCNLSFNTGSGAVLLTR
jgi:hypothetical protein